MSDTPEIDSIIVQRLCIHKRDSSIQHMELIDAEVARKLKRERDEAREDVMKLQDIKRKHEHEELAAAQENDRLKQERDEAREQNAKFRDIAEKAIELAVQYYDGPCERDAAKLRAELDKLKECGK